MLPKDRIQAVMDGRAPDRVPVMHGSFSSRIASAILGREAHVGGGMQQYREAVAVWSGPDAHAEFLERSRRDAIDVALAFGHDIIRCSYWRMPAKPAARIDEFTFRYEHPDGSWEVRRLDPPTELFNVIEQSPRPETKLEDLDAAVEAEERAVGEYEPTDENFADVIAALKKVGDRCAIRSHGPWTSIPVDEPAWLEATLIRPDLVGRLLDTQATRSIRNARILAKYGLKYTFGGGDFASNQGPMYSPRVFHELMLPRLKRISDEYHRLGLYHFFASDGNLWAVADDLFGASGLDGYYEMDRRAGMDIREVHARFPRLVMFGNIASHTLHMGTADEVIAETRACIDEARETNRVVVGCSNIIISETPMRNVEAMMRTIERYR